MKLLVYGIYLLILAVPVITWIQGGYLKDPDSHAWANLFGLVAFTLIFLQITLGSFMNLFRPVLGNKAILNFHIWQGIAAFIFANLHPAMFAIAFGLDIVLTLGGFVIWGRIALILLILTVAAGLLRTVPLMQKYWRWVHRLNYLIFVLIYWHSWNLGTDVRYFPMVLVYWLSPAVVTAGLIYKLFYPKIRAWHLEMRSEN